MPPPRKRRRTSREPPERLPWLRYDRMARAVTEHLRVRPVPGQPFWLLAVHNPVHHTRYQVALPEYPGGEAQFCSCVDFARKGIGTCKHVEAAHAWLAAHPDIVRPHSVPRGTAAVWKEIDSVQHRGRSGTPLEPVGLRAAGRVLFEKRSSAAARSAKKGEGGKGSAPPVGTPGA